MYLKPAGVQWDRCGTVLLRNSVTGVAVRRLIMAKAASNHTTLFKVCRAALARVAAHAVLSAPRLQDGLSGDEFSIPHIHKQPDKKATLMIKRTSTGVIVIQQVGFMMQPLLFLPVNVCWCCDFVNFMMAVSITVAVFLFPLWMFLLLFPFTELQCRVFSCVDPHLMKKIEAEKSDSVLNCTIKRKGQNI